MAVLTAQYLYKISAKIPNGLEWHHICLDRARASKRVATIKSYWCYRGAAIQASPVAYWWFWTAWTVHTSGWRDGGYENCYAQQAGTGLGRVHAQAATSIPEKEHDICIGLRWWWKLTSKTVPSFMQLSLFHCCSMLPARKQRMPRQVPSSKLELLKSGLNAFNSGTTASPWRWT